MKLKLIMILLICCAGLGTTWGYADSDNIPTSARIALYNAQELAKQGKFKQATELLRLFQAKKDKVDHKTAERKGYSHYLIDFAIGTYQLTQSQSDQAMLNFKTVVKKNADYSSGWLNLATCYYDLGKMKPAADAFLKGYETGDPKQAKYLYYSLICQMAIGDDLAALDLIHRLEKDHPAAITLEWKEAFVQVYLSVGKPRLALPIIVELSIRSTGEQQKKWQELLLNQYIYLKMDKEAIAYTNIRIKNDTTESKWWKAFVHLSLQKNQYHEALVALLACSFIQPLSPEELSLLADLYGVLDIPSQAVKFYEDFLQKDFDSNILKKIVHGYLRLHDPKTALLWIERGIDQQTSLDMHTKKDLLMLKGHVLFEMEQFSEAALIFNQIARQSQKEGEAWLMLGYAEWQTGRITKAKKAFEHAKQYSAQNKQAVRALLQIR